ncbi:MAG: 4-hydroxy-3-methylbut-2-enyl diphosphate reductase [Dehalococcoidia bacterium]|nr:4-hydroxy-3-methylbut-2-enyl diphosphate reductase [Dehalococcoidia bacterium]
METCRARELGLCYGVRRALDMLKETSALHGPIETLGPVAHNTILVEELTSLNVKAVNAPQAVTASVVAISAHGVSPETTDELRERGLTIVDTTCPTVARAQQIARVLSDEGFTIVIFGDANHTEVKGLLGWAGPRGIAALATGDLQIDGRNLDIRKVAVISQTTQRIAQFASFAQELCGTLLDGAEEVRIINTLCTATQRRLEAAAELAQDVDVMLVVGGKHSANTRRLAETCDALITTYHIESAKELDKAWFEGKSRIGITAGASTPDSSIEDVERALQAL